MNILIFGATSGIGKELAKRYVSDGHHVIITGRRLEKLKKIQEKNPTYYTIYQHDVTAYEATNIIFKEVAAAHKIIDVVIYSSGVGNPNYKLDWEIEIPTLETNVMGAVKVFTSSYQFFRKQGFGHLVSISSVAGVRGNRHVPAYFASKAFQNNYLESLWLKGKRSKANISVTDIIPGFVDTAMAKGATFWMASTEKATKQIYNAIKKKKKRAYITKRWRFVALIMRITPSWILVKI